MSYAQPNPLPTNSYAKRFRQVRERNGLDIKTFHQRLVDEGGAAVSYAAARHYDFDRVAPPQYFHAVSEVFGVRLQWLIAGNGPMTAETLAAAEVAVAESENAGKPMQVFQENIDRFDGFLDYLPMFNRLSPWAQHALHDLHMTVVTAPHLDFSDPEKWVELAQMVARAIRAPLDEFGLLPDDECPPGLDYFVVQQCLALRGYIIRQWEEETRDAPLGGRGRGVD